MALPPAPIALSKPPITAAVAAPATRFIGKGPVIAVITALPPAIIASPIFAAVLAAEFPTDTPVLVVSDTISARSIPILNICIAFSTAASAL